MVYTDTISNKSELNKVRKAQLQRQEWHLDAIAHLQRAIKGQMHEIGARISMQQ